MASRTCNWNLRTMRQLLTLRFPSFRLWFNLGGSFATLRALHNVADSLTGALPVVQNGGDLVGYGSSTLASRARARRAAVVPTTLGNHPHACEDFRQRAAPAKLETHLAIAAQRAGAGQNRSPRPPVRSAFPVARRERSLSETFRPIRG